MSAKTPRYEVDLEVATSDICPLSPQDIQELCAFVLTQEKIERDCMVSVTLCSSTEIAKLNSQWRGFDKPTDVISLECESPFDEDLAPGEPCELGDIILAPAYIKEQASSLKTPFDAEFELLLIHGMLHLLGYDHLQEDEAQIMEAREDKLLALWRGEAQIHHMLTRHKGGDEV